MRLEHHYLNQGDGRNRVQHLHEVCGNAKTAIQIPDNFHQETPQLCQLLTFWVELPEFKQWICDLIAFLQQAF